MQLHVGRMAVVHTCVVPQLVEQKMEEAVAPQLVEEHAEEIVEAQLVEQQMRASQGSFGRVADRP
jgi:hypothetical protein